jgi:tetratricopeptide (TPR) repeat protein
MGEGLLGGILGDEGEKPEATAPDAVASTEAFAAAVAARFAGNDPEVARDTSAFLKKQAQFLETQNKLLQDEHALRLAHLRHRSHLLRGQRFGQGIRIAVQLATGLIVIVVGIGIAVMLHDAFNSRTVVVDLFEAPAPLAARGITGTVLAGALLDELTHMQEATRSSANAKRDLAGAWSNDVKLAVPEAGVSLAELSRALKARFGHDLHIGGAVVETRAGGLALTVRGDKLASMTFTGAVDELESLTTKAAEYVYARSQPRQWAAYLGNAGRFEEQVAFCRSAYTGSDAEDRAYLLTVWGRGLQRAGRPMVEGLGLFQAAIKLKPDLWSAHAALQNTLWSLGDEEGAWRAGEEMRRLAGGRPGRARSRDYDNWDALTWNLGEWLDAVVADARANAGVGTAGDAAGIEIADVYGRMHDWQAAEIALQTTLEDPKEPVVGALKHLVRGRLALEAGDRARAAAEMDAFGTAYANPAASASIPSFNCWIAPAEEAAGHPDKADAVLNAAGKFLDCYRFRGDILAARGDWLGAEKAYAEAVALAPDLPAGYYSWGLALSKHGDLGAAASKLKDASRYGPHWADPLKAWGDVLLKQGKSGEASAKYDEALLYAPNWKDLKEARDAVAKLKG